MVNRIAVPRRLQTLGIVVAFVAIFATLSLTTDTFLTTQNLVNVLDQSVVVGILACGVGICIIAGVFDLSLSAVLVLAAIVSVTVSDAAGTFTGFFVAVVVGALLGLFNGLVVNYGHINSFIGTLGTSIVYRGIAVVLTAGEIVRTNAIGFNFFSERTSIGRITWASWFFLAVIVITGIVLARTTFGRSIYGVGGNEEAARLSGIRVKVVRTLALTLSGALAGLAGGIWASRAMAADPSMAMGVEFTAIIAAIVGGISIMGGEGAVWRAVIGVFILALIGNGFNLLGLDANYQQIVQGVLILLAMGSDQFMKRRWR